MFYLVTLCIQIVVDVPLHMKWIVMIILKEDLNIKLMYSVLVTKLFRREWWLVNKHHRTILRFRRINHLLSVWNWCWNSIIIEWNTNKNRTWKITKVFLWKIIETRFRLISVMDNTLGSFHNLFIVHFWGRLKKCFQTQTN